MVDEYILDFEALEWVEPFGMLWVSGEIQRHSNQGTRFLAKNFTVNSYAAHMGFFQALGMNYGKLPGEVTGNLNYVPITILKVDELTKEARQQFKEIGKIVEKRSEQLSKLLTRQEKGDLVDMLTYAFQEIIRNVIEHSRSKTIQYCAQYWPTKQLVEIAILDTGVGIKASLSENPYLCVESDREALNLSLMPGISGKTYKGKPVDPYDVWQNSGFGLYITSRLCGNGGSFFICSGNTGLLLDDSGRTYFTASFQGTALRLQLRTSRTETLKQSLKSFLKEGDEIAKSYSGNNRLTASKASRMLSADFERDDS